MVHATCLPRASCRQGIALGALIGLLAGFLAAPASAQRLHADRFSESEGLPSSQIRSLAQDANGRLWILTRGGLASFDGREIRTFDEVAQTETRNFVALTRDSRGAVWALGNRIPLQLVRFDGTDWIGLPAATELGPPQESERATALAVAQSGGADWVVVGTTHGLYTLRAGAWSRVDLPGGFADAPVYSLASHGDEVFVASRGGLCVLRVEALDCSLKQVSMRLSEPIYALSLEDARDGTSRLWLGGAQWTASLDLTSRTLGNLETGIELTGSSAYTIGADGQGGVFFGNGTGAWLIDLQQRDRLRLGLETGLAGDGLTAFLHDREGNLWLGSIRGLSRIASRRFVSFGADQGLLDDEVTAVAETEPRSYIFGHNRGLSLLDLGGATQIPFEVRPGEVIGESRVMQIAVGPDGEVVFAAVQRGVGRLQRNGRVFWYPPASGLPPAVYSVQFDANGRLLVAGGADGLFERRGNRFERVDLDGRWPSFVRRVVPLSNGSLYLATSEGVFWQDADGWHQAYVLEGRMEGNDVYDVLLDGSGRVLVGTAAGLYQVEGDRLTQVALTEPSLDRPVFLLLEDGGGHLWMGTDNGVYLWDGDRMAHHSVGHGLAGREINRSAGVTDDRGRVWVGTEGGVSVYRARFDGAAPVAPPIAEISGVEVGDKQHPVDQRVDLKPGDNDLFFRVSGISLNHEPQLLMKYFLEGYDEEWLGPQPLTSAPIRYTNLPPGEYKFQFRVGRGDGVWSATRTSGAIVVGQPLWQKPWLQGLGLLLLAGVALALYRFDVAKRRAALHDPLTGLPNRMLFTQRLRAALERKGRAGEPGFAVLFLDLDRFKNINDSLGHAAGDQLLIEIARRLTGCVQASDTVSRLGGDEFTVLLDGIRRGEDVGSVAQRLQRAFEAPFRLRGHDVFAGASIGIALGSAQYKTPEEVLRDADTAMYRAKEHGGGRYEFFDPSMHEKAVVLLRLETDLRRALERGQLRLYYQPVVRLDTGEQVGCEALLRWQHPERGLLAPQAFLDVAEETGLILPIGEWVLREACAQLAAWRGAGALPERFTLAVNVSPKQLARPDLAERIAQILRVAGWSGMDLTLEITESSLMSGPDSLKWLLKRCRDIGVSFSIDDFGTGHSSLSYLQNFPVQALKIDRGFVARMGTNPASVEIVRTIVDLGRNLGLEVVAEGVETARQAAYLRAIGCNLAQGYLFSGPIPAASLIQYITVPKAI